MSDTEISVGDEQPINISAGDEQPINIGLITEQPINITLADETALEISVGDEQPINIDIQDGIGVLSFLNLTDTPSVYSGEAGKFVKVKDTEDGLEFSEATGTTDEKVGVDSDATADYLGTTSSNGVLRTSSPLTYNDGGDYVILGVDETAIDHNNLTNTHNLTTDIDHGNIGGLGDDDHTQYHNNTRGDSRYLYKENTDPFTPDSDYEPATKKYVDDNSVTDHGGLTGLDPDDDHTQYLLTNGNRICTGQQLFQAGIIVDEDQTAYFGTGGQGQISYVLLTEDFVIKCVFQDADLIFGINDGGVNKTITWDADVDKLKHSHGLFDFDDDNLATTGSLTIDTNTLAVNLPSYENRVGIGTATPSQKLHIFESTLDAIVTIESDGDNAYLYIDSALQKNTGVILLEAGGIDWGITNQGAVDDSFLIFNGSATEGLKLIGQGETIDMEIPSGSATAKNFISNIAVGTQPYACTSTTVNTNLNADMLDGKHVGTSGNAVPLLDGANTWTGWQEFDEDITIYDDRLLGFGTGIDAGIQWQTTGSVHWLEIQTKVGIVGGSGAITIVEQGDAGVANRYPAIRDDPYLRIYSADGTQADDYLEFYHDQTDARIDWGNGNLQFGTAADKIQFRSSGETISSANVGELSLEGGVEIRGYIGGNQKLSISASGITIGSGEGNRDYNITIVGESSTGQLTWMEDEDYFKYSDDILMDSTERLYFRDSGIFIYSNADGEMTIEADTKVTMGVAGNIELGDGTQRDLFPNTDLKIDLGSSSNRFNEGWIHELHVQQDVTDVSDPPTDAELDAIFGTPATLGRGFIATVDDNDANTDVWLVYTSDTSWFYLQGTKAV